MFDITIEPQNSAQFSQPHPILFAFLPHTTRRPCGMQELKDEWRDARADKSGYKETPLGIGTGVPELVTAQQSLQIMVTAPTMETLATVVLLGATTVQGIGVGPL